MAFLDFEKAFDRVNCQFRDLIMAKMGFPPPSFITAVQGLYTNSCNHLLINGSPSRPSYIAQSRGVRQGCPLSPFLFAILPLLRLLLRSLAPQDPSRPPCGFPIPPHYGAPSVCMVASQFADDTTVYAQSADALRYTSCKLNFV